MRPMPTVISDIATRPLPRSGFRTRRWIASARRPVAATRAERRDRQVLGEARIEDQPHIGAEREIFAVGRN